MEVNMQYYDKYDVGKRIRMLRKNKHLTQSELSNCLDYTNERQLQRIESGESACSVDKLMEVAQVLETSTDFLLFGNSFYEKIKCLSWKIYSRQGVRERNCLLKK